MSSKTSSPITNATPSRRSTRKKAHVNIVSYNVLSSHLAGANHFTSCDPAFLGESYRYDGLIEKLEEEIKNNAIITLQEVSHLWSGRLHAFFAARGYHFITANYGQKFNGYMGVATAVPLHAYELVEVDITRIVDTKKMPRKVPPSWFVGIFLSIFAFFKGLFQSLLKFFGMWKQTPELWDSVMYRSNQMICVRLRSMTTGQSFVVGNYHMPCMFQLPSVMIVHCALSAQHLQRYAKEDPYVYCGDFNIQPDSPMYTLLTCGSIPESNPDFPINQEGDDWRPVVDPPFNSAYAVFFGAEPEFTNFAKVKNDPVFCATLDYIFCSPHWTVNSARELPAAKDVAGPLPNADEYSDHILIAADIMLD